MFDHTKRFSRILCKMVCSLPLLLYSSIYVLLSFPLAALFLLITNIESHRQAFAADGSWLALVISYLAPVYNIPFDMYKWNFGLVAHAMKLTLNIILDGNFLIPSLYPSHRTVSNYSQLSSYHLIAYVFF